MGTLILSISGLIGIFILNIVVGLLLGFGRKHYWFFELLHFLGGFFVAMFFANFFSSRASILLGLTAVTLLWELMEYLIAKIPTLSRRFQKTFRTGDTKYDLKDTILDVFLNFVGALLFIFVAL